MTAWTLQVGSTLRPLAAWGAERVTLTRYSLESDTLTLRVPTEDVLSIGDIAYGDTVTLRRDAEVYFVGTLVRLPSEGSARREQRTLTAVSAWWQLERLVYQQRMKVVGTNCAESLGEYTPKVVLGQNDFARQLTVGEQLQAIVTYALTRGVGVTPGAYPSIGVVPFDEVIDITCAEAIRRLIRWSPDCVQWFDYSSGAPVLNFGARDTLTAVELDVEDAGPLVEFNLEPRHDLVPAGVQFIYLQGELQEDERTRTTISRDSAGVADGVGSIVCTLELASSDTVPASGLALRYYAALQAVPYQGTLKLRERECSGLIRPGHVVNIANGLSAWATMRALVQNTTEDLLTGETTVEVGPPEHLSPQDFIALQELVRKRARATEFPRTRTCRKQDPEEEVPEDPESEDALTDNDEGGLDPSMLRLEESIHSAANIALHTLSIKYCDAGEEQTAQVYGPPIGG